MDSGGANEHGQQGRCTAPVTAGPPCKAEPNPRSGDTLRGPLLAKLCPTTLHPYVGKRLAEELGGFFFRTLSHDWVTLRIQKRGHLLIQPHGALVEDLEYTQCCSKCGLTRTGRTDGEYTVKWVQS